MKELRFTNRRVLGDDPGEREIFATMAHRMPAVVIDNGTGYAICVAMDDFLAENAAESMLWLWSRFYILTHVPHLGERVQCAVDLLSMNQI